MTDIAALHVATIRAGQYDPHADNDSLSRVTHDQKTHYYDLIGMNVSANDFRIFVESAWDIALEETVTVDIWGCPGIWSVSLD